jgi:hypothetical protein
VSLLSNLQPADTGREGRDCTEEKKTGGKIPTVKKSKEKDKTHRQ